MKFIRIIKRTLRRILRDFSTIDYYVGLTFRILSISFIGLLWIYLIGQGALDIEIERIVAYFLMIASAHYLFTYKFSTEFASMLDNEFEEAQLSPGGIMAFAFRNKLLPLIIESIPLMGLVIIGSISVGILTIESVLVMLALIVVANFYYFFFSISMEIVAKFIGWSEYMSFTMRYIGLTWNGSYIPFIFLKGVLGGILKYSPFMASGLFLQLLWDKSFNWQDFLTPLLVGLLLWGILALLAVKTYSAIKK